MTQNEQLRMLLVGKSDAAEDCVWLIDAMIQEAGE